MKKIMLLLGMCTFFSLIMPVNLVANVQEDCRKMKDNFFALADIIKKIDKIPLYQAFNKENTQFRELLDCGLPSYENENERILKNAAESLDRILKVCNNDDDCRKAWNAYVEGK